MSETYQEQLERVKMMSEDNGQTWDLSDNDKAALKAVLNRLVDTENDRKRLNWIEEIGGDVAWKHKSWAILAGLPDIKCLDPDPDNRALPTFSTLREAIDHAASVE